MVAAVLQIAFTLTLAAAAVALEPVFLKSLRNVTVPEGREAAFTCIVRHLGGHKVAWIKADSKAILAIHDVVITHFGRLSVVHSDHSTWTLTLRDVRRSDSGPYMCQVNTDPMRYQVGHLEVVVPPDIVTAETSSDIIIPEGGSARLQCRARGHPPPTITWQREDGQHIVLRHNRKRKVRTFTGEVLQLDSVTRSEMGVYLCIANNGIPPRVSKRTMVTVNFPPMLEVANALIAAPLGDTVTMLCRVEASPKAIYYWARHKEMILSSGRHVEAGLQASMYVYHMNLTIAPVAADDFGTYSCVARNSIGQAEGSVVLRQMHLATAAPPARAPADLEQSGHLLFADDEELAYPDQPESEPEPDRPDGRRGPQVPQRPTLVLTEQAKSGGARPEAPHLLHLLTTAMPQLLQLLAVIAAVLLPGRLPPRSW